MNLHQSKRTVSNARYEFERSIMVIVGTDCLLNTNLMGTILSHKCLPLSKNV
jgi:hypothetical protein